MKRALFLIVALVLCLSLCACGAGEKMPNIDFGGGEEPPANDLGNEQEEELVIYDENGSFAYLNQNKLHEIVEVVELTTENWRDYLKVYFYSYDEKIVERDAFGEIISTETVTRTGRVLDAGNERYHQYVDFAIELKDKATGEMTVYQADFLSLGSLSVPEDFQIDNYECTRIKGKLYFIDLPDEVIERYDNYIVFSIGGVSSWLWPSCRIARGTNIVYGNNAIAEIMESAL